MFWSTCVNASAPPSAVVSPPKLKLAGLVTNCVALRRSPVTGSYVLLPSPKFGSVVSVPRM